MSTLAAGLFVMLGVLLVASIAIVVVAGIRLLRKGNILRREMRGFSVEFGHVVGSVRLPEREDGPGQ